MKKTVFIENKSGVVHETTEEIARYMVWKWECTYAIPESTEETEIPESTEETQKIDGRRKKVTK